MATPAQSPRMAPAAAEAVPAAHPMEGASPEPKRPKARGDATATPMQQSLSLSEVIAGLGDLHGRVARDENYFAGIHDVVDFNAGVLSAVMARVLNLEQGAVTAVDQMKQLGKDAEDNDVKLDNALREQLNQVTTRLEEKNTELMDKLAVSEKNIWEKIGLFDSMATGTASALARIGGAVGPAQPPGLESGRLAALEEALKELNGRLVAVNSAQSAQITGTEAQVQGMGANLSALERTVIDLVRRATLLEACPAPEASVSGGWIRCRRRSGGRACDRA